MQSVIQHLSLDLIGNLSVDTFNGTQVILAFLAQIRCVVEASVTQGLSNALLHTWANAQPINEVVIGEYSMLILFIGVVLVGYGIGYLFVSGFAP